MGIDPNAPVMRKRKRGVALLPSLFTLGNCLCGLASIHYASNEGLESWATFGSANPSDSFGRALFPFAKAGYCIFGAMLFDLFDGFIARLTRSSSDFGAELDSLADMVSFGVAPAFLSINLISLLVHQNAPPGMRTLDIPGPFSPDDKARFFWVIAVIYVCCTAMRLARFN